MSTFVNTLPALVASSYEIMPVMDEHDQKENEWDEAGYYAALQRFMLAKHHLIQLFRAAGELTISVPFLTKDRIGIEVEIRFHGEGGFAYIIEDEIAAFCLDAWKGDERIVRKKYLGAKADFIHVQIESGGRFVLRFDGIFKAGNLDFPDACVIEEIGEEFEIDYTFLTVRSNRVHVKVPR